MRPKQQELRNRLLRWDQSCVLTGEKEEAALEAAHIVPVQAGGHENVENAILLRADLHRLFDAGLFWFDLSEAGAAIRYSDTLSAGYNKYWRVRSFLIPHWSALHGLFAKEQNCVVAKFLPA
jgi:hypothetical protein